MHCNSAVAWAWYPDLLRLYATYAMSGTAAGTPAVRCRRWAAASANTSKEKAGRHSEGKCWAIASAVPTAPRNTQQYSKWSRPQAR